MRLREIFYPENVARLRRPLVGAEPRQRVETWPTYIPALGKPSPELTTVDRQQVNAIEYLQGPQETVV